MQLRYHQRSCLCIIEKNQKFNFYQMGFMWIQDQWKENSQSFMITPRKCLIGSIHRCDQINSSFLLLFAIKLNLSLQYELTIIIHLIVEIMKRFLCKRLFSYSERALTPKIYSELLHQKINNHSMSEIMHNMNLFDNSIQLFDYDYYNKISIKILDYQNMMSTHDILTVLRLGVKHNVKNQFLWKHLEGQLHRRLHNVLSPLIEHEKNEAIKQLQSVVKKFESDSKDYFQMLAQKQQQNQSKAQQNLNFKSTDGESQKHKNITNQQDKNLATDSIQNKLVNKILKKEIMLQIESFVEVLAWYGSTDFKFLTLLLEAFIHPQLVKKSPSTILRTAQLLVYTCQMNMKQYSTNKSKYTGRSIKRIYKFQGFYFSQILSSMKQMISQFKDEQIRYLTDVIGSFPLKKRKHRMQFVSQICNQWSKRGRLASQEKQKLEDILSKDQKLIARFKLIADKIQQNNNQKLESPKEKKISLSP